MNDNYINKNIISDRNPTHDLWKRGWEARQKKTKHQEENKSEEKKNKQEGGNKKYHIKTMSKDGDENRMV